MLISQLPEPRDREGRSIKPPELPSGTFILYRDAGIDSESKSFNLAEYPPERRHSLAGGGFDDATTWIAFNLPEGKVVTLMTHHREPEDGQPVWDLRYTGETVDLVGTGTPQLVDLDAIYMGDKLSSFFWRQVDLNQGAIELFEEFDYKGSRTLLFISEWADEERHALNGWYIEDRLSSVRWSTLDDTVVVRLFETRKKEEGGRSFNEIHGAGKVKEIPDLTRHDFDNVLSSFLWTRIIPERAVIKSFKIKFDETNFEDGSVKNYTVIQEGLNDSPVDQPGKISLSHEISETVTLTISDEHRVGAKFGFRHLSKAGVGDAGTESEVTIELSYDYTHRDEKESSKTVTTVTALEQDFIKPRYSSFKCEMVAMVGRLKPTTFRTDVTRWYNQDLPGTVKEIDEVTRKTLYRRDEMLVGRIEGSFCYKVRLEIKSTPIPGRPPPQA
ncbi:hypothetical protein [Corallococcus macrosporus]|uniref:Uncharacterized protein n=1 Tax=Myxococcus fulvus (strain ATCC BAA-855 / HW-1) TaxID=483219 RepID=F8CNE8_MYXFH|nr:hypothetical protein [Corallococcus macrosporus]AEI62865.1 hypothetical protein LILAB_04720 [Corallococcus macrosporus]